MYAGAPEQIRRRLQRGAKKRKGRTPMDVLRRQAGLRRLQAYQYGAYDSQESGAQYEGDAQFFNGLQEELHKEFYPTRRPMSGLPSWWLGGEGGMGDTAAQRAESHSFIQQQGAYGDLDDDLTAGGLGLKIKLKLPKFIRKMKPLKVLGKAAKIAAPIVGLATGGILLPAVIGAGGSVLQKGKKAKLFKDVVGSAAVGAAGGVARRAAPSAFKFLKGGARKLLTAGKKVQSVLSPGGDAQIPGAPETPDYVDTSMIPTYSTPITPGYTVSAPSYAPMVASAAYTPPGDEPVDQYVAQPDAAGNVSEPPVSNLKKLLVPALIVGAMLL